MNQGPAFLNHDQSQKHFPGLFGTRQVAWFQGESLGNRTNMGPGFNPG